MAGSHKASLLLSGLRGHKHGNVPQVRWKLCGTKDNSDAEIVRGSGLGVPRDIEMSLSGCFYCWEGKWKERRQARAGAVSGVNEAPAGVWVRYQHSLDCVLSEIVSLTLKVVSRGCHHFNIPSDIDAGDDKFRTWSKPA